MKKWLGVFTIAFLLAVGAWAEGRNFGLGLVLGDPTGFTAKYWTSSTTALDFGLGWSGYWNQFDPACNDGVYYDNHRHYCDTRAYYYHDGYGNNGWDIFHLHADYLFHNFNLIHATERFPIFYGPGVAVNYYDYNYLQIGIRGDFGIAWMPRRAPMDLFLEIAPTFDIIPGPHLGVSAGLGGRYYF